MRVIKVLNNSLVLALNDEGQEIILMGKGIGFQKTIGYKLSPKEIDKVFVLKDRELSRRIIRLAAETDSIYFEMAKSVIDFAGSVAFASSMGIGIVFSGLSVLAVEGVMTLLASLLLRLVEKKMDGSDSYELVQADSLTMTAGTYSHPNKGTPFDERSLSDPKEGN